MKPDNKAGGPWLYALGLVPVIWFALLIAPAISGGLSEIVSALPAAMNHPFKIVWCEDSVKTVLIFIAAYGLGIGIYLSSRRNYRRGEEHGSAKWGDPRAVNKKYRDKDPFKNRIFTQHVRMGLDGRKHRRNLNTLVVGGSGAGKSRFYAKVNICQCNTSLFILDCKGELLRDCGGLLERMGYEIKVVDLLNMEKSHCYNPFAYLKSDNDVQKMVTNLFKATTPKGSQSNDPFWDTAASMLLMALVFYLWYEAPEDEKNFPMIMEMLPARDLVVGGIAAGMPGALAVGVQPEGAFPQVVLGDQLVGGRFIAAQIQKFIAVADDGFPLLFKQRLELGNVLDDDGNADIPGTHGGQQLVEIIGQRNIRKLVHQKMHWCGQAAAVYPVGRIKKLLEGAGIQQAYQKIEAGVVVRDQRKERHFFLTQAGKVQFIRGGKSRHRRKIEFFQAGRQGDLDGFQRFGRAGTVILVILHSDVIRGAHFQPVKQFVKRRLVGIIILPHLPGSELMTPDEVRMLDNNLALLFIRGEAPLMDEKYDLLKHPNIKYTTDGGAAAFTHGGTENAVADMVIGRLTPGDLANIQEPETLYELLSDEDMENIFQFKEDTQNEID